MDFSDLYSGSALSGAGQGAIAGGMVGGPYGALIGGGLGLYTGARANAMRDDAANAQKKNLAQVAASQRMLSQQAYGQYMQGLDKALAFYGPVAQRWNYLYGMPGQQQFTATPSASGGK